MAFILDLISYKNCILQYNTIQYKNNVILISNIVLNK